MRRTGRRDRPLELPLPGRLMQQPDRRLMVGGGRIARVLGRSRLEGRRWCCRGRTGRSALGLGRESELPVARLQALRRDEVGWDDVEARGSATALVDGCGCRRRFGPVRGRRRWRCTGRGPPAKVMICRVGHTRAEVGPASLGRAARSRELLTRSRGTGLWARWFRDDDHRFVQLRGENDGNFRPTPWRSSCVRRSAAARPTSSRELADPSHPTGRNWQSSGVAWRATRQETAQLHGLRGAVLLHVDVVLSLFVLRRLIKQEPQPRIGREARWSKLASCCHRQSLALIQSAADRSEQRERHTSVLPHLATTPAPRTVST